MAGLYRGKCCVQCVVFFAEELVDVQQHQQALFKPDETVEVLLSETGNRRRRFSDIFVGNPQDLIQAVDDAAESVTVEEGADGGFEGCGSTGCPAGG